MNAIDVFFAEVRKNILRMGRDANVQKKTHEWVEAIAPYKYSYNFTWMGRPIIQYPQDIVAMQEIIWRVKPQVIIETGVAHGGSVVFYASMLELIKNGGIVIGIDSEIRPHNRLEIEQHPMYKNIRLLEGSSIDDKIVDQTRGLIKGRSPVMVLLDSNHTHHHVLNELRLYSPFVTKGSYLVVFDTAIEDYPAEMFADRPWGPGNSPKSALREFLKHNERFQVDTNIHDKLLITVAPDGYLKCIKD